MDFGFILILFFFTYWILRLLKRRRLFYKYIQRNKKHLEKAVIEFEELIAQPNLYFDGYSFFKWQTTYTNLFSGIDLKVLNRSKSEEELLKKCKAFTEYYSEGDSIRKDYNAKFLVSELDSTKSMFDNIMGHSLDSQQRKAIIKNEDNTLIIAGAGTGKTLTLSAKVLYLIDRYKLDPTELQLISFTNKSCDEMRHRIKDRLGLDIDVRTFNKLGFDIIKSVEKENQPNVCDLNTKQVIQLIQSILENLMKDDEDFKLKLIDYFLKYLKPYKPASDFEKEGDYYNFMKDNRYQGFKIVEHENTDGGKYTYREVYKSLEELEIANFLLFNNIDFKYENPYKYKTASSDYTQYQPDFYLPEYDIYLEHFGIDKKGNVPRWFESSADKTATQLYQESIKWKRELHSKNKTKLIETYSWMKQDDILTDSLEKILIANGVQINPKTPDEIWELINNKEIDEVSNFTILLHNFLVLAKSNKTNINHIKERLKILDDSKSIEYARKLAFLDLYNPIYDRYQTYLESKNEIDFSDMINMAVDYIESKFFVPNFKYLLIDEFQDISAGRFNLINSFLEHNPAIKLFCVGDDWQSIYRFSGSDIGLFTQFGEINKNVGYNRKTEIEYIEQTYRFGKSIIDISSDFVLKNENQVKKTLKSNIDDKEEIPYTIIQDIDTKDDIGPIQRIFSDIKKRIDDNISSILFLGRYNHDITKLEEIEDVSLKWDRGFNCYKGWHTSYPDLEFKFMTVHAAKGLEADFVVLLNLERGKYGFPSEITDDPILDLLLSSNDNYPNSEERRLFYVALTRAKKHMYFIVNKNNASKFVVELVGDKIGDESAEICPKCNTGILETREGKYGDFKGCSNYPYCNYIYNIADRNIDRTSQVFLSTPKKDKIKRCAKEGCTGILERRSGKYGAFLGCSNYPICSYTESIN